MGSIGFEIKRGTKTADAFRELNPGCGDIAVKGGVVYAVAETTIGGETRKLALVSPFSRGRIDPYYGTQEIVFKSQDETMGPVDVGCPDRILNQLDEPINEYAAEWRQKCREAAVNQRNAREAAKRVRAGAILRFAEPLYFGKRYGRFDRFRYSGKGTGFTAIDEDGDYLLGVRITRWQEREYTIEGVAA